MTALPTCKCAIFATSHSLVIPTVPLSFRPLPCHSDHSLVIPTTPLSFRPLPCHSDHSLVIPTNGRNLLSASADKSFVFHPGRLDLVAWTRMRVVPSEERRCRTVGRTALPYRGRAALQRRVSRPKRTRASARWSPSVRAYKGNGPPRRRPVCFDARSLVASS